MHGWSYNESKFEVTETHHLPEVLFKPRFLKKTSGPDLRGAREFFQTLCVKHDVVGECAAKRVRLDIADSSSSTVART